MADPAGRALVWREDVRDEWIDYNGHLSEAYYVLVFGNATTALMDHVGLDAAYRERSGASLYTVEAHVRYLREVAPAAELTVRSRVLGRDAKRARIVHEMHVDGVAVATEELMTLHVTPDGVAPFPASVGAALDAVLAAPPDYAGRAVQPLGAS